MNIKQNIEEKEIVLGPEYSDELFSALSKVLKSEGANQISSNWGLGGSQEISEWEIEIKNFKIKVRAETYIGLSITGPTGLINKIAEEVKKQMAC